MQKILIPSLLIILIFLCGCEKNSDVNPITQNISFTVETVFQNQEYCFSAQTDNNSNLKITVNFPENLKSLKLYFNADTVEMDFWGLKKEIPLSSFEEDSLFRMVYEGITTAKNAEELKLENDNFFTEFKIGSNYYKMLFGESGLPIGIRNTDNSLDIQFKSINLN